ncbi:hypothetical protein [Rheinheimera gaetbuli]
MAVVLLLVLAALWLANRYSSTAAVAAEGDKPQPLQDSTIARKPVENVTADHDPLSNAKLGTATDNDGKLVIMTRPDWALDSNLLSHFSRLNHSAQQGDSEAAYVLGMNLRNCYVVPEDAAALAERLQQAYQFNDNGEAAAHISERYDFCLGVDKQQRNQFYAYLAMAASKGYVPAQEAIAMITPEQYMLATGYASLERNGYVAKRSGFIQQQVDFLSSAAQHGSLKALIKLSQLHHAQTVGKDGRLQAYAFNQMIMELTDDTELYNRYNWFQQRGQSVFTPEEIEQAMAMSEQWLSIIQANGTLYLHSD